MKRAINLYLSEEAIAALTNAAEKLGLSASAWLEMRLRKPVPAPVAPKPEPSKPAPTHPPIPTNVRRTRG